MLQDFEVCLTILGHFALKGERVCPSKGSLFRSSQPEVFCKKGLNFIKKETLAQVFSCEFCEISKNTFSHRTPPVAASDFFLRCNAFIVNVLGFLIIAFQ